MVGERRRDVIYEVNKRTRNRMNTGCFSYYGTLENGIYDCSDKDNHNGGTVHRALSFIAFWLMTNYFLI